MKCKKVELLGMSEEKLVELCDGGFRPKLKFFWTTEVYGFGKYMRKYGYYPKFLPLAIFNEHGVGSLFVKPWHYELESLAPVMFYHSPDSVRIWNKFSNKPCYVLYSPFVFYRRSNKIIQNKKAVGTIVFPVHTIPSIGEISDTQKYINQLKKLPKKFHPISVCLHFQDVRIGRHKIYLKNNISVYTAGDNPNFFIERFYDILKKFKYASSNQVSSCLFYAVEAGIPFFIHGSRPELINKSNPAVSLGRYNSYKGHKYYQMLHELFSDLECRITKKKRKIIERNLGIYDGVSRKKMAYILYTSLFKLFLSRSFYKEFGRPGIRLLSKKIRNLLSVKE